MDTLSQETTRDIQGTRLSLKLWPLPLIICSGHKLSPRIHKQPKKICNHLTLCIYVWKDNVVKQVIVCFSAAASVADQARPLLLGKALLSQSTTSFPFFTTTFFLLLLVWATIAITSTIIIRQKETEEQYDEASTHSPHLGCRYIHWYIQTLIHSTTVMLWKNSCCPPTLVRSEANTSSMLRFSMCSQWSLTHY